MSSSISSVPEGPPLDGSLLFSDLINFHMQKNPTFPIFIYADDQAPNGTTEITFLEFGRAAHRIAHVLRPAHQGEVGQVVMLIANTDTILYHAALAGMSLAGLVPFLVSPRNSAAAVADMMKKTNCSRIVTLHHAHRNLMESIQEEISVHDLIFDELPTLPYAFPKLGHEVESDPFDPYPPVPRPDLDKPAIYVHSSGSTGFPKPIAHSYKVQIHWLTQPVLEGYRYLSAPRRVADPHVPPVIPSSDNVLDTLRRTKCNVLITVPTFVEQWATSKDAVEDLKKMDLVLFGGGPLPVPIGDALCAAGVPIGSQYGGTEFGGPMLLPDRKDIADGDWLWMRSGDNIKTTETNQMSVENLPDIKGYATSDLFVKHPTKDMWRIVGRADDKTVPAPMEGIIGSSPLLQGTVMFGRERNQVGILVEPRLEHVVDIRDDKAIAEFRNKIWPLIEEANKTAPAFSRIFKEMILITDHDKPMLRTPKGTVQKKATVKAYQTEIDALYNAIEATFESPYGLAGPSAWTADVLEGWLTEHACAISQGHSIDPGVDLFVQGFDSLSVTYLRNQLINALRKSQDPNIQSAVSRLSLNIIFENPTIKQLAARISSVVSEGGASQTVDAKEQHITAMNAMIEKYSFGLNDTAEGVRTNGATNGDTHGRAVVLLTGSTGGLGSFLLSQLLENPMVERVYALNRPSSSTSIEERQISAFLDRGLSVDLLRSSKLVYVEADASQDRCGLSAALYDEIRGSITTIIHAAWRLDFNLSLASFEHNIKATRNLVDLGLVSRHRNSLCFVFTSSVGSAQSWDREKGPFPEEVQLDPSPAVGAGYGEGKYVSERIIVKSGLHATSLRIGQIAGGPNGSWATTDWVPIIVKSSIALGALPDANGIVSWMRAEEVATSVLDITFAIEAPPPALNVVNPRVLHAILKQKSLGSEELPMVPFKDWLALLEKKAEGATSEDLVNIPAIKLLEFFRSMARSDEGPRARTGAQTVNLEAGGMASFSTAKSQLVSKTISEMQPVGAAEASSWVQYWISKGFL
ncbi:acetyl-CoA synthetase-like protein [Melanogaster broomeanus]|nr:acetyl-CoA synthetase-like protein [Melanogaster broomeanus]